MSTPEAQTPDGKFRFFAADGSGRLQPGGFAPALIIGDRAVDTAAAPVVAGVVGATLRLCNGGAVAIRILIVTADEPTPTASGGLLLRADSEMLLTLPYAAQVWAWAASATSINIAVGQ
jgi:hypothetical protein